jgi:hypothetical protein
MNLSRLSILLLATGLAWLPPGAGAEQPSGNLNDSDNTSWNRRLDDTRVDRIRLHSDRFDTVTRVVLITPDCAFRSGTRAITRRNVNRLGITQDIPFIGGLFGATPRAGRLNASNQVGAAFLQDGTLYVDARPAPGPGTAEAGLLTALASGGAVDSGVTLALAGNAPALANLSVVNRDFQFLLPPSGFEAFAPLGGRCGAGALAALPALAPLFRRTEGTAHLLDGQLMVLVPPSIIAR